MSRYLQPPRVTDQISETKTRVDSIERRLGQKVPPPTPYEIPFSLAGAVTVSESLRARHPRGGRLILVDAHLQTAGSTDTVLSVNKSGISVGTLTLPAGATYADVAFDVLFSARLETLSIAVTTAGTDAEDLSVFANFDQ